MTSSPSTSLRRLCVALVAVVIVLILGHLQIGGNYILWAELIRQTDRNIHDVFIRSAGGPPEREDFVLLGIDEASLSLSGLSDEALNANETLDLMSKRFPWDRRVWAAIIDKLGHAGAKLVVLDLVFAEPSTPEGDDAMAAAISRHPEKVILISAFGPTGQINRDREAMALSEPYVQFLESDPEPRIGYANFWPDKVDGSCRSARYRTTLGKENGKPLNGEPELLSVAGQIIDALGGEVPHGDHELRFTTQKETWGSEVYPPRSVYEVLVDDLWEKNYDNGRFFKDKVVMIGPVASRFQDIKKTPAGHLTGPQLHLQAAACGLANAFVYHMGYSLYVMAVLGLLGAIVAGCLVKPRTSTLAVLSLIGTFVLIAWWLGTYKSTMIPITGPLLTIGIGWMSAQVYQLIRERLEKSQLRGQFRRFVSRDVADRLVDQPKAWHEIAAGRKRQVVVLFSDVRDFTSRSEVSEPTELVKQLNEYLTEMVAVVFRHGGTLDKFIGDAVMAHWGTLDDDEDGEHARAALAAAREMLTSLNQLNERWIKEGRAPFKIGIGIHLGEAVAAEIGSPEKIEFGVIGDAVNLASRIEGLTKTFGCDVMFSSQVNDAAGHTSAINLGAVRVKGRTAPVELFAYGDEKSIAEKLAALERDDEGVVVMTSK